ncbi:hypothetical protein H175_16p06 (plasmid) [Bacillus thuringiensis serovar thuringiensis str. IS5056]|nr:hypothetical protein H175_16p06 [Bacillus thuringiensis serovar thuringiensis str. IS5056]
MGKFAWVCISRTGTRVFGLGKTVVYRRLKELVEQGVLKRERILYDYGNVYWVTKDGVELCESEMAAGKKPSVNNFVHDKKLVDLSVQLLKNMRDQVG